MTITAETSSIPGFVAELVRAANEVNRLTAGEIENSLLRAMATVHDLREQAGIPGDIIAPIRKLGEKKWKATRQDAADVAETLANIRTYFMPKRATQKF